MKKLVIRCHICGTDKRCSLVTGAKLYPHRKDLRDRKFWQCPTCGGYVGTHRNSKKNAPLGSIVSKDVKIIRQKIHARLDPLYEAGHYTRPEIYGYLTENLGWDYHTAKVKSVEEGKAVLELIEELWGDTL